MPTKYEVLLDAVHEIHDLTKVRAVLIWDRQVNMPDAGASARTEQVTVLSRLIHAKFTSDEMGEKIESAAAELDGADYDSDEASLIRYLRRSYRDERALSVDFVSRSSQASGAARQAWVKARAENDFPHFQPWLEQIVLLCQEKAKLYGYKEERYDALLDKYEHGMTTARVRALFNDVKQELLPLRQAIANSESEVDDSLLHQPFAINSQQEFARYIVAAVGYDLNRGHLGETVHPFASSFSRDDARITTRYYHDFLSPALFGSLHEAGHALYEQGTHTNLARTPLARGTSSGIHESQSRMFENIVGRSLGFWQAHYAKLQSLFPHELGGHSVEGFYRAINKVQPSFIRVEADEVNYNLHIILRFELEQAMLDGELAVADLPSAWNDKMQEFIGVVPPNDTQGCLQDVHWSSPFFGYFPTYALGNMYAAQLYEAARTQDPTISADMEAGQTASLLAWLVENIHQHGRKFTADELMQRATGSPLGHQPLIRYLKAKFGQIYQL